MPDEPKSEPKSAEQSGTGLWAIGWKVLGMNAEQQRGVVAIVLTIFLMWWVWDSVNEGRRAENERTAMMVRAFESEGEKSRQAVNDVGKITVASHQKLAAELGKLELRLADMNTTTQRLEQRVGELQKQMMELGAVITELRKKMPPSEVNMAPPPKAKSLTAVG